MPSDFMVIIFDVLILILGFYGIASAIRMKDTGIPSALLVRQDEIPRMRDVKGFCSQMSQPTVVFSAAASLYGAADLLNQYVLKLAYVDIIGIFCFLIVCIWYVRKLRQAREVHG